MRFPFAKLIPSRAALALALCAALAALPPQAPAAGAGLEQSQPWLAQFQNPPASARPMIFLVWNGEITRPRITAMLEQYKARGIGGVFIHPRPGLITEYLSPAWFDAWEFALAECHRLGLECHIYDENSYPSGFAGGWTVGSDPLLASESLNCKKFTAPASLPEGQVLGVFAAKGPGERPVRTGNGAVQKASPQNPVYVVFSKPDAPRSNTAHYPYPDLSRPETTEIFLKVTHDQYAKRFSQSFGKEIKYVFTDEPYLQSGNKLTISSYLLAEFEAEHGYKLTDRLDALCFGGEGAEAVRFDYFLTLQRLWVGSFLKPYHDWCEKHGLAFTGHFWDHEWPKPNPHPGHMNSMRWQQVPGNDMLAFQFRPTDFAANGVWYLQVKELGSIANQLGRKRVLTESCGGGGYDFTLRDFKPLEDFLLAAGVNVINPHLSQETISGARKYDWPQTLSDHSPWWDAYGLEATHVGRAVHALTQGRERNRVLVLHPDTTAWLLFDPAGPAALPRLAELKKTHIETLQALHARQIDFDLGDELTLAELGKVEGGKLRLGECVYDAVVIPPAMNNLMDSTLKLLAGYMAAQGKVYSTESIPAFVNGRPAKVGELAAKMPNQWRRTRDVNELAGVLREAVRPYLSNSDGSPLPQALLWKRNELPGGAVLYFFCHPWRKPFKGELKVEGKSLFALDTMSGAIKPLASREAGSGQVAALDLPELGDVLWLALPEKQAVPAGQPKAELKPVALDLKSIRRTAPNMLTLDYCDLDAGIAKAEGISTVAADEMNWKAQGFEKNLWSQSSQHRRSFIDARPRAGSGFVVSYRFTIAPEAFAQVKDSLAVVVERPWLYKAALNGQPLEFPKEAFYDEGMRKAAVAALARPGENVLTLDAHPFQTLCEIMPVYVLGDFGLKPTAKGFVIGAAPALAYGRWDAQGLPFYPNHVAYEYAFATERPANRLALALGSWQGAVARVRVDGKEAGFIAFPPERLELDQPLGVGEHRLEIEVAGNLKNLFGPHFSDGLPGLWTWRLCPPQAPAGEKYRFYPAGLLAAPKLELGQ